MMFREKGNHTWDIYLRYHRCPQCGFIIESRVPFEFNDGRYEKTVECARCHESFVLTHSKKAHYARQY